MPTMLADALLTANRLKGRLDELWERREERPMTPMDRKQLRMLIQKVEDCSMHEALNGIGL